MTDHVDRLLSGVFVIAAVAGTIIVLRSALALFTITEVVTLAAQILVGVCVTALVAYAIGAAFDRMGWI